MAIEFLCPSCHNTLRMENDAAGRLVRCGQCLATLKVPEAPSPEPSFPSEPRPSLSPAPRRTRRNDVDEYGEPRQASTRKKSKSVLFWLVLIAGSLAVFTCLVCGGIVLVLATPHWHTHESADGGYKVDFPAPLNPDVAQQAKLKQKGNERVEGTLLAGRLEMYWVASSDFDPNQPRPNDDELLKKTVEGLGTELSGAVFGETPKTVDGYPAREVVYSVHDNSVIHCLIVITKTKAYVAAAGGSFVSTAGNKRIRRFLDSFHVVENKANPWRNPKPKGE